MTENNTQEIAENIAEESTSVIQVASELDNDPTSATQDPEPDLVQPEPGSNVIDVPTEPETAQQTVPGSPELETETDPVEPSEPEVVEVEEIPQPLVNQDIDWGLVVVIVLVIAAIAASVWYFVIRKK